MHKHKNKPLYINYRIVCNMMSYKMTSFNIQMASMTKNYVLVFIFYPPYCFIYARKTTIDAIILKRPLLGRCMCGFIFTGISQHMPEGNLI